MLYPCEPGFQLLNFIGVFEPLDVQRIKEVFVFFGEIGVDFVHQAFTDFFQPVIDGMIRTFIYAKQQWCGFTSSQHRRFP
jgi:hypothetical protein